MDVYGAPAWNGQEIRGQDLAECYNDEEIRIVFREGAAETGLGGIVGLKNFKMACQGLFFHWRRDHFLPPAPGAVVALEMRLGDNSGEQSLVRARAVVRWTRQQDEPEGMGVEFIEFDGLKDLTLMELMSRVLEQKPD